MFARPLPTFVVAVWLPKLASERTRSALIDANTPRLGLKTSSRKSSDTVSPVTESFGPSGLLEEPHYTRPAEFRGWPVPDVLRSGDHGRIDRWRRAQAIRRTVRDRPDLIEARGGLTDTERRLLEEFPPVTYP